jgi:hypothetical protein
MSMRQLILATVLLALAATLPGCGLFGPRQPEQPNTVEGWMAQDRIEKARFK